MTAGQGVRHGRIVVPTRPEHSTRTSPPTRTGPGSFPLHRVRLLDSDFKAAQETSVRYVLSLEADRLCAPYLLAAGLESPAHPYGSWESEGMGGHIGGHYLSACAKLFAATGNPELLASARYVLGVLVRCQDAATDGYVGGVPGGRDLGNQLSRGEVDADLFTLNGRWVPLYNLHKTLAGLLDAHQFAGLTDALEAATALADWWLGVSARLDQPAFERLLRTEFGGMNDAFALLWGFTGDDRYLAEAHRFAHRSILDPLAADQDRLDGLHANTQIPKVVGYARIASATGDPAYARAVDTFWDSVVSRRSVSVGGNSVREHFHPAADFSSMVQDPQGPETCNTYNMLKLAQLRFEASGDPAAIDFYERATYNHILSSQHPASGGLVYFTPMRPAHYRVYSKAQESMWCCVGSGLENHARYGELIYSHTDTDLLVNLYIPSTLDWTERGLTFRLETDFPGSGLVTLTITATAPVDATVRLRRPGWATAMTVDGGGQGSTQATPPAEAGDVRLVRRWAGTSTVRIRLTAGLQAEALPDGSPWVSFRYGPMVLAARGGTDGVPGFEAADQRMGHVAAGTLKPLAGTPVVPDPEALSRRRTPSFAAELDVIDPAGQPATVILEPFHRIHDCRYTVYWPTGEPAELRASLQAMDRAAARAARVVDAVAAGEQQPEADHKLAGKDTVAGGAGGLHWRDAGGWFSYVLTDPANRATILRVRFLPGDAHQHILRLNGALLTGPAQGPDDGGPPASDFDITGVARNGDGLVFTVTAVPGFRTGRLVSVQLVNGLE